jgi:hypothetical protein
MKNQLGMFSQPWRLLIAASVLAAPVVYFFLLLAVSPPAAGTFAGSWLARIADPIMLVGIFLAGIAGATRRHFAWALSIGFLAGAVRWLVGYSYSAEVYGREAASQMAVLFVIWAILIAGYAYIGGGVLNEISRRLGRGRADTPGRADPAG